MGDIQVKCTKNPKMFSIHGTNNVVGLMRGDTKLDGLGLTVQELCIQQANGMSNETKENNE